MMLRMCDRFEVWSKELNNGLRDFLDSIEGSEIKIDELKDTQINKLKEILFYSSIIHPHRLSGIDSLQRMECNSDELYLFGDNDKLEIRLCYD